MGNEVVITVEGFLWFCGVIITLGAASAVIAKWVAPAKKLRKDVDGKVGRSEFEALKAEFEKLKTEFERLKQYQDADHRELKKIETGNEKICHCLLAIMDHELDGNSKEHLKKAKHDMEAYLIEK